MAEQHERPPGEILPVEPKLDDIAEAGLSVAGGVRAEGNGPVRGKIHGAVDGRSVFRWGLTRDKVLKTGKQ